MPPIIPQAMLKKYHEAHNVEREAKAVRERLRDKILHLVGNGAPVEPGKFDLKIEEREAQTLSWKKLAAILDDDEIEFLRDEVPLTVTTCVQVRPKAAAKTSGTYKKPANYCGG